MKTWHMKAPLMSGLSLVAIGFVLAAAAPAQAERPRPRRAAPRSAVVRDARPAPTAPASVAAPARYGAAMVVAAAAGAAPPALDVAAGCVPVWVVDGRVIRRLPDRCPEPSGAGSPALTPATRRAPRSEPSPRDPGRSGAVARVAASASATPRLATAGVAPLEGAAPRRRASRKPPAGCARSRTSVDAAGARRGRPPCQ